MPKTDAPGLRLRSRGLDDVPVQIASTASATTTTLAGTPAYIAPELLRGEPATVASDQFSFCVATWEALYGERPFAGATLGELRGHMARGAVRDSQGPMPSKIRAALLLQPRSLSSNV